MTVTIESLAARIEALEAVLVDVLALAAEEAPRLRKIIADRLTEITEDFRDMENSPEAEAVSFLKEEFMRNT